MGANQDDLNAHLSSTNEYVAGLIIATLCLILTTFCCIVPYMCCLNRRMRAQRQKELLSGDKTVDLTPDDETQQQDDTEVGF